MFKELSNNDGYLTTECFKAVLNLFILRDRTIAEGYRELHSSDRYYKEWKPSLYLDHSTINNLAEMSDDSFNSIFQKPLESYHKIYCLLQSGSVLVVDTQAKQFISVNLTKVNLSKIFNLFLRVL